MLTATDLMWFCRDCREQVKRDLTKVKELEMESKKMKPTTPKNAPEAEDMVQMDERDVAKIEEKVGLKMKEIREQYNWTRVSNRRKKQVSRPRALVEIKNSFEALEEVDETPFSPTPSEVVIVGDSQVRYLGDRIAMKNRVCCYPGARIATIADKLGLGDEKSEVIMDNSSDVIIHVGGNDTMGVGFE